MGIDTVIEDFQLLDDWQDRYRYVIDLGKDLTPMADADRNEQYRVPGCLSQVWLKPDYHDGKLDFIADSDAHIVKGLIAMLMIIYSGKTPAEILAINIENIFQQLDMQEHLSPNRRNGFFAMVGKIQNYARQYA